MHGYLSEIFASFQGEGARVGERHLFLRFAGCNLRCRYCDTPESLERTPTWKWYEPDADAVRVLENPVSTADLHRAVAHFRAHDPGLQMLAVTGGEPLLQAKFLRAFFQQGGLDLPVLLETSGMLPARLAVVLPFIHVVSMDIKLPCNSGERPLWEAHREFLAMARERECYVKVLVDQHTEANEVARACDLVHEIAPHVPVFLQPIVGALGDLQIDEPGLRALFRTARAHHPQVRVVPQVHKLLHIR